MAFASTLSSSARSDGCSSAGSVSLLGVSAKLSSCVWSTDQSRDIFTCAVCAEKKRTFGSFRTAQHPCVTSGYLYSAAHLVRS